MDQAKKTGVKFEGHSKLHLYTINDCISGLGHILLATKSMVNLNYSDFK